MNARSVLILSLGLNLILAGWVVSKWQRRASLPSNSPTLTESTERSHLPLRMQRTNLIEVVTNFVEGPGFRWSQIETNDFRAYAANLRAVGCPDRTVQHLLFAELDEFYRERIDQEPAHPFWETASQRSNRQRELERRKTALRAEQRALLRELAGVQYSPATYETWRKEKEGVAVLGFLTDDKAMGVIDLIESTEQQGKAIRSEARGVLIEEDQQKIETLMAATHQAFASTLAPAELEELQLRLMAMLQNRHSLPDDGLVGTDITGWELRALTQLATSGRDAMELLVRMIALSGDLDEFSQPAPETFEAEARKLLGDRRYAAYVRSGDEKFRTAYDITKRQNLSPAAAESAYEAHRAAELELQRLVADDSINGENRRTAIGQIRTVTEQAIREALGEDGAKRYLDRRPIQIPGQRSEKTP